MRGTLESNQEFSVASISSGFSMPASSHGLESRGDSVRVGAYHETAMSDRIQNMLDRKFNEFDEPRQEQKEGASNNVAAASSSAAIGAHYEANVPDRIQDMLDRKFNEFGQSQEGFSAYAVETREVRSPVQAKIQSFQPTHVKSSPMNLRDKLQAAGHDDPELASQQHRNIAPAATKFTMWNAGTDKNSVATPSPDILANRMMDDQEMALSGVERKEARLAAGLCPDCGRTQTHEKMKYGPFQAFRKMEPLTTPGSVYKGYCRFCNNLHDLRRFLQEPYLREQDLDGTTSSLLTDIEAEKLADMGIITIGNDEQEFSRNKHRIQICLCIAVLAVIAGGIGLDIYFVSNNEATSATSVAASPPPPPTPAPGPLGWHQVGTDISKPIKSFGYKVSISGEGNRVAVASPIASNNVGVSTSLNFSTPPSSGKLLAFPFLVTLKRTWRASPWTCPWTACTLL